MADTKRVMVSYYGLLGTVAGTRQEEVLLEDMSNVGELLDLLASQHGSGFRQMILAEDGTILPYVRIWVGRREITQVTGRAAILDRDDRVSVVAARPGKPAGYQFYEPTYIKTARRDGRY